MANTKTYYTDLDGIKNIDLGIPIYLWDRPKKGITNYLVQVLTSLVETVDEEDDVLIVYQVHKVKFNGKKIKFK